jgi:aromatic ring hydroxylase
LNYDLNYYKYCQENDVFVAHAAINPQVDRSKASSEQKDPYAHLRVVRKPKDGLLVRGVKMISRYFGSNHAKTYAKTNFA